MTKIPFKQYTAAFNGGRSIEEALSELERELIVRRRIFDNWVTEGRCTWTDAHDRLERLLSAMRHLIKYSQLVDEEAKRKQPEQTTPFPSMEAENVPHDESIDAEYVDNHLATVSA